MREGSPRQTRWRRVAVALAVLLAVLAAGDAAVWWVVTSRMEAAVPGALAAAAQDGWRIEATGMRRGGWPFRATVRLTDASAVRNLGTVELRWTAEALDLVLGPRAPTVLAVVPRGPQTVRMGAGPALRLRADTMAVLVPLAGDGPMAARASGLVLRAADGRALAVERLDARFDGLVLAGTADGIVPTPAMAAPFDGPARLGLRIVSSQPFPAAASPAASATAWQRAGGRVQVPEFSLRLASLGVDGSGDGGLDATLQPEGRATLRVQGAGAVLDAAARAGLVASGPASAARAVLDLLSAAARGGAVSVPVLLQDGVLTVARFPLVRVPVLDWGTGP